MADNINIIVNETNEIVNVVSSTVKEVIDVNIYPITETVTFNVTEQLIKVNVNSVTGGGLVTSVNGQIGDVIVNSGVGTATVVYVDQQDALKVDKVSGKSLISDTEITRLATLANFDNSANVTALNNKVDKVTGSRLITTPEATILSNTSGVNSGDETASTIKTKLGITNLSGSNTGDQDLSGLELQLNKQNSLSVDGTGVKYPTVDAVNLGIANINTNAIDKITVKLATAINKGQAVYVSSASGTNIIVSKASNTTEATSSKTIGLLETTGVANDIVNVVIDGLLTGLNTLTAIIGDPVWLGTNGDLIYGLTNKPFAPSHLVYIGVVTRVNINNGEILVKVQNGFELKEIHDVAINGVSDKQLLSYDNATSLWKNKSVTTADILDSTNKRYVTDSNLTTISNQSGTNTGDQDLSGLVVKNTAITGSTKTKITYDAKGLVTAGSDATTADIADSTNKRYVTDANLTTIGNQSGTNTGDETITTIKSKLGITTLSGSNTGDQDLSGKVDKVTGSRLITSAESTLLGNTSGVNSGDETTSTIKTKLGITTLSGSNTGDQDLSGKVDKVTGKSLIADTEITRLSTIVNYDNSSNVTALNTKLTKSGDTITGDIGNSSTGYFRLPNGTTAQRPASPFAGMHRYNTDTLRDEFYANGAWQNHARLSGDTFTGSISATNLSGTNTGDQDLTGLVIKNAAITGATKTKITYDAKGLVTAGADATTADIADSTNKRYQTDNQNSFNDATSSIQTQINSKGVGSVTSVSALTIGTSGTDLSSSVATGTSTPVITLNVPNASFTNRGVLNSTDYTYFFQKQQALVNGTNIKSINNNSLLGSGSISTIGVHGSIIPLNPYSVTQSIGSLGTTAFAGATNRLVLSPFIPIQTITSTALYINVSILLSSSNAQILIYSDLNGKPDTKIYQSSSLDCSTLGIKTATTIQTFLANTIYWIGVQTSSTQGLTGISTSGLIPIAVNGVTFYTSLYVTPAFGSAPTTFGTGTLTNTTALVGINL